MSPDRAPAPARNNASEQAGARVRAVFSNEWLLFVVLLFFAVGLVSLLVTVFPGADTRVGTTSDTPAEEIIRVNYTFGTPKLLGLPLMRDSPASDTGFILLALIAGGIGSAIHAMSSLVAFVGNNRFVKSWIMWYYARIPVGALLGLTIYMVLRAGLLTANGDPTNPYGVVAIGLLSGLFAKKAVSKLKEVFDVLFRTEREDKDPLVEHAGSATDRTSPPMILAINPSPVPNIEATPGALTLTIATSAPLEMATTLKLDQLTRPLRLIDLSTFECELPEATRAQLAGRQVEVTVLGTPEDLPITQTATLPFEAEPPAE